MRLTRLLGLHWATDATLGVFLHLLWALDDRRTREEMGLPLMMLTP